MRARTFNSDVRVAASVVRKMLQCVTLITAGEDETAIRSAAAAADAPGRVPARFTGVPPPPGR